MTTGERIRFYRKKLGLTQKRLGQISGTSEISVRKYELGLRKPKIEALRKVSSAMNIDVAKLLSDEMCSLDTKGQFMEILVTLKMNGAVELIEISDGDDQRGVAVLIRDSDIQDKLKDILDFQ